MVARWIANLILLLMLIGLVLGIRYELMVTESSRARTASPADSGDTEVNWRRVELEPSPADTEPASSPASPLVPRSVPPAPPEPVPPLGILPPDGAPGPPDAPASGPLQESAESPPVVHLSPDGGQPTMRSAQDQTAADAAFGGGAGTRPLKAAPQGFGVDPFAPDEPGPQGARSKSGGVLTPRSQ